MSQNDESVKVRPGEEFDVNKVGEFIRSKIPGVTGPISVEQYPSGYSNLTYLIKLGEKELVLRRPPLGRKAKTAHDMKREYTILNALHPVFPLCPKPLCYTDDESIMGDSFYIMDRLEGIILRKEMPSGIELEPDEMRTLCENLTDTQLRLHSINYEKIGLADFGKPEGYVRRQVEGWSERYRTARTDDAPSFDEVMKWLSANIRPDLDRPAIIHNDYKFDNVVLKRDSPLQIIGILDWEMATIGDPLMDLGSSLAYWVQNDDPPEAQAIRLLPTNVPGALTRAQIVERYTTKAGIRVDNFDFYYCFGLFRLAVIAQQIYYRYFHGQTKDTRFKTLIFAVHSLEKSCLRTMRGKGL